MIRRLLASALILSAMLAAATPALACRARVSAAWRIDYLHRGGHVRGVLLVRVTEAGYTAPAQYDYHPWEARSALVRVVHGPRRTGPLLFGRSGSSAACDDGLPPPRPGALWVLYLTGDGPGGPSVNISLPLDQARQADPRLADLLR